VHLPGAPLLPQPPPALLPALLFPLHEALTRVLAPRHEAHADASTRAFIAVARALDAFIRRSHALLALRHPLAAPPPLLAALLQSHARAHILSVLAAAVPRVVAAVDAETWAPAQPPAWVQPVMDSLYGTAAPPPPRPAHGGDAPALLLLDAQFAAAGLPVPPTSADAPSAGSVPYLSCFRPLVALLHALVAVAALVPAVLPAAIPRATPVLLAFNSRASQLVLGAGIMASIGVRAVTATHLAHAVAATALLASQLPVLRALLTPLLAPPARALLAPWQPLLRDVQLHEARLLAKLASMLGAACKAACLGILDAPWAQTGTHDAPDAAAPLPPAATEVEPCVRTLVKQVRALGRVLRAALAPEQRARVLAEVAPLCTGLCFKYLARLDLARPVVQVRVHLNVQAMLRELREAAGDERFCEQLEVLLIGGDEDEDEDEDGEGAAAEPAPAPGPASGSSCDSHFSIGAGTPANAGDTVAEVEEKDA
jgi:hypothetical protein